MMKIISDIICKWRAKISVISVLLSITLSNLFKHSMLCMFLLENKKMLKNGVCLLDNTPNIISSCKF